MMQSGGNLNTVLTDVTWYECSLISFMALHVDVPLDLFDLLKTSENLKWWYGQNTYHYMKH